MGRYFDDIDDASIEGLEQNQDFFSLLLNDEEIKHEVLGIVTEEIYNPLKKAAEEYILLQLNIVFSKEVLQWRLKTPES